MSKRWIGPGDDYGVGDFGFLIERANHNSGAETYVLSDWPAHNNVSGEPRLQGWCGSFNNVSTYALGVCKVIKVARNGRAHVQELSGEDLVGALHELGYPALLPAVGEES